MSYFRMNDHELGCEVATKVMEWFYFDGWWHKKDPPEALIYPADSHIKGCWDPCNNPTHRDEMMDEVERRGLYLCVCKRYDDDLQECSVDRKCSHGLPEELVCEIAETRGRAVCLAVLGAV